MKLKKVNWGIIGLGAIAHHFVKDLLLVENANLVAVASRNYSKAMNFSKEYDIAVSYGSYDELFDDTTVDIIYIATPHHNHAEISIKAISKGKHVLCEKPLAVNLPDAMRIVKCAEKNNVFFMEALWARFNPSLQKIFELIQNNEIGEVNYINADFSFYTPKDKDGRLYNMDLAGGALLDIGIYPLFLSYMIFGKPEQIEANAIFDVGGADIQTAMILKYKNALSSLYCGIKSSSDMIAKICGTKGTILIDKYWYKTQGFSLVTEDGKEIRYEFPTKGRGYYYEIIECNKCIEQQEKESDLWTHQNSFDLISMMDAIREKIGLKYPFE